MSRTDKQISRNSDFNISVNKKNFVTAKIGNIKEEYFFEQNVGHGGFGVVYKAQNRLTLKRVAIKAIPKYKIQNQESFLKEFRFLSNIDHPNIVNIIEIWEWNDIFFIVTEYC